VKSLGDHDHDGLLKTVILNKLVLFISWSHQVLLTVLEDWLTCAWGGMYLTQRGYDKSASDTDGEKNLLLLHISLVLIGLKIYILNTSTWGKRCQCCLFQLCSHYGKITHLELVQNFIFCFQLILTCLFHAI
jgi:hypothetical protein